MKCFICKNNQNNKIDGISFHRFPKNGALKKKWINAIGSPALDIICSDVICSEHFIEDKDFKLERTKSGARCLKKCAIPSKKLPKKTVISKNSTYCSTKLLRKLPIKPEIEEGPYQLTETNFNNYLEVPSKNVIDTVTPFSENFTRDGYSEFPIKTKVEEEQLTETTLSSFHNISSKDVTNTTTPFNENSTRDGYLELPTTEESEESCFQLDETSFLEMSSKNVIDTATSFNKNSTCDGYFELPIEIDSEEDSYQLNTTKLNGFRKTVTDTATPSNENFTGDGYLEFPTEIRLEETPYQPPEANLNNFVKVFITKKNTTNDTKIKVVKDFDLATNDVITKPTLGIPSKSILGRKCTEVNQSFAKQFEDFVNRFDCTKDVIKSKYP